MRFPILIADDEEDTLSLLKSSLTAAGFHTVEASDGTTALELTRKETPALVVLDQPMPGMNGLDVCRELKRHPATERIAVIILAAKPDEVDRVLAFELGADDFLTKPFSARELILRIRAILRRQGGVSAEDNVFTAGDLRLDIEQHRVTVRGVPIDLTAVEFKLLSILLQRGGRVQSREALLQAVWGNDHDIDIRTVDTHLRRMREKLGSAGDQIRTVRGFGYRLDEQ